MRLFGVIYFSIKLDTVRRLCQVFRTVFEKTCWAIANPHAIDRQMPPYIVQQELQTHLSLPIPVPEPALLKLKPGSQVRSEEHTSELQSRSDLVCRLLLEKKKKK